MMTPCKHLKAFFLCLLAWWTSFPVYAQPLDAEKFENLLYINPHQALRYYQTIFTETSPDHNPSLWLQAAVKLNSTYFHIGDLTEVPKVLAKVLDRAAQSSEKGTYAQLLLQHHIILLNQGDQDGSLAALDKAFQEAKAAEFAPVLALVQLYMAKEAHRQGLKDKAIDLLQQANITLKDSPHDARYYALMNNIASLFNDLNGQLGESLRIFPEITEYFDRHGLHFLGSIAYENYANALVSSEQLDAAVRSYEKSVEHASAIQDDYGIASSALGMGDVYRKQKRHRQAIDQYQLARRLFVKFDDPSALSRLDTALAQSYVALGQSELALPLVRKWKAFIETTSPDSQAAFTAIEAEVFESLGQHSEALQSYRNLTKLQQNIFDAKRQELANRYYTEFEVERRNQENLKLEHQNRLQSIQIENQIKVTRSTLLALGAAVVALVVMTFSFYRAQQNRRKIESLQRYIEKNVLQRFLPPVLVQEILTGKSRLDDRTKMETVTVLFADLCQFTRATDRLGPETISHILNDFFVNMSEVIFSERGTIDKFIGDAIMVIFGAPSPLSPEEQARSAVRCARKMQNKLNELNRMWELSEGQHFEMRVGIHQGQAVVGTFGGSKRSDYTVVGTTVNIAARVENIADPNSIMVTEAITQFLDSRDFILRGPYQLRGLDVEIPLFQIELCSALDTDLEQAS
jgi:class 3 adenylate cyclase